MERIPRQAADELSPEKIAEILDRLKKGQAKARVAREAKVSRSTVYKLAYGQHISQRRGDPSFTRCNGCGYKILQPCRICSLRNMGPSTT